MNLTPKLPSTFIKNKFSEFEEKISCTFDYDFSIVSQRIDDIEQFEEKIKKPYESGKQMFYRGERTASNERGLLPTMLRNPDWFLENSDSGIVHIDAKTIFDIFDAQGDFVNLFRQTMGEVSPDKLYELCAFAQHYFNFSPLIDFTKSFYAALSFAVKDRDTYDDDIVLYEIILNDEKKDYTTDVETANKWLSELDIFISSVDREIKKVLADKKPSKNLFKVREDIINDIEKIINQYTPDAKIIDVPINTRMKFQQGVFLLLTDFHLHGVNYFTSDLRDDFSITKYIINKDICPEIREIIHREAPWYCYKYIMDEKAAFQASVDKINNSNE